MDKAKAAINDFMHRAGHHDTTVHETVAPGVEHEVVKPHQHEDVQTAVDKEVHQDHYHRTVQPVQDREVLPEQHTAKLGAVQHKEFDHRDTEGTKKALAADQDGYRDERAIEDTTYSTSVAPAVGGEHVHHHIHETIQPVVKKETIQPNVVHTTVPIHETHHNAAKHHETSELPSITMSEFKGKGGVLGGREERYDGFEGEPHNISGAVSSMKSGNVQHNSRHQGMEKLTAASQHDDFDLLDGRFTDTRRTESDMSGTSSSGGIGRNLDKSTSLLDRTSPMKDADGDGKAGFTK
ncbi:hypothetical protein CC78DRAFT_458470 [Lojkania enalia]|uniref:Allergen n=1 Tax=Lojkania enalia TaxID=147567 RepID=A0A9P4N7L6_9PLEO|nr:hypothetical protein CC78DRAFT_458470 [Didymosphaeria enalia]